MSRLQQPVSGYFKWHWSASCGRCGYKSRHYRSERLAHVLAVIHSVTKHPYGHMTIAAVDDHQYRANREGIEIKPEQKR